MKDVFNLAAEIQNLIAKGELKKALLETQKLLKGSPLFYEVILQSARYSDLMKSVHLGTIDYQNAATEKNKIQRALLEMIYELEDFDKQDEKIQQELMQYAAQRYPSIHNSTSISGDGNYNFQGNTDSQISININKKE